MESPNRPPRLPVINPDATAEQMVRLCKEGATFEKACRNLTSETLGELLDNAHQPPDPNMTDKEPHMGVASLAEQGEEGRTAWNDKALKRRAAGTRHIDLYIMTKIFPDMMVEVGDHQVSMLVPYHTRPLKELVVTGRIDVEAWQAAQSGVRESTTDLPVEALRADVDQPAREIIELCSRMTDDVVALETAALRRNTDKILDVLTRIGLQVRGAEALAKVQRDGLEF